MTFDKLLNLLYKLEQRSKDASMKQALHELRKTLEKNGITN